MNDDLLTVGKRGELVTLEKIEIKNGFNSGVKPGKKIKITLGKPIEIGHPVVKMTTSKHSRSAGMPKCYKQTTNVERITRNGEDKSCVVETETSIYHITL